MLIAISFVIFVLLLPTYTTMYVKQVEVAY